MALSVELLVIPDCPNAQRAQDLLSRVVTRLASHTEVLRTVVKDETEAVKLAFPGSPTVRINGEDVVASVTEPPAFACRRYDGGDGVPPEWLIEARVLRALRPRHLLFLCVANSARSQMAEAIARSLAPEGVRISSAGSAPSRVNPFAIRALDEIGLDASDQRSKGIDELREAEGRDVDAVITLCAEEVCPIWLGQASRLHWPLPDPAAVAGSDDQILGSFRKVRDELRRRLSALLG